MFPVTMKTGATHAATGGTDVIFSVIRNNNSGVDLAVTADTDTRLRRTMTIGITASRPQPSAPGGYTQNRAKCLLRKPKLLANGQYSTSTFKAEVAIEPEMTLAEMKEGCEFLAQTLYGAMQDLYTKQVTV